MRSSGILLPIFSLPSKYGIGCFSIEAYEFIDMLKRAGQKYWQILPLCPVGKGNSPYQSFSTYAGNPYFIDLGALIAEGLLTQDECDEFTYSEEPTKVDYQSIYATRESLFKKAHSRFCVDEGFGSFTRDNGYWLEDYVLYSALKEVNNGKAWTTWSEELRDRHPSVLQEKREELADELQYHRFLQYKFYQQWQRLKAYANEIGIGIVGDIPIYVAFDSADTWANPMLFQFNENNELIAVAGCPPDGFSATGQIWESPLYSWEYHRETGYQWWVQRMQHTFTLYDVVRIDHFRGFESYYSIPYGDETAEFGHWEKGPGIDFFDVLKERLGEMSVIAEDLGLLTDEVRHLVAGTGFPNMKVIEFAFDAGSDCEYLPHTYYENCVVYTGTHDNDTLVGWLRSMSEYTKKFSDKYLDMEDKSEEEKAWTFIRAALASVAAGAIIPMQDYLCLDSEARMNTPSTVGGNWEWRLEQGQITAELLDRIKDLTDIYGRQQ